MKGGDILATSLAEAEQMVENGVRLTQKLMTQFERSVKHLDDKAAIAKREAKARRVRVDALLAKDAENKEKAGVLGEPLPV